MNCQNGITKMSNVINNLHIIFDGIYIFNNIIKMSTVELSCHKIFRSINNFQASYLYNSSLELISTYELL